MKDLYLVENFGMRTHFTCMIPIFQEYIKNEKRICDQYHPRTGALFMHKRCLKEGDEKKWTVGLPLAVNWGMMMSLCVFLYFFQKPYCIRSATFVLYVKYIWCPPACPIILRNVFALFLLSEYIDVSVKINCIILIKKRVMCGKTSSSYKMLQCKLSVLAVTSANYSPFQKNWGSDWWEFQWKGNSENSVFLET